MTRKDTILIAVIVNTGLLAILFTTAMFEDTDRVLDKVDMSGSPVADMRPPVAEVAPSIVAEGSPVDEVDAVLRHYTPSPQPPTLIQEVPSIVSETIIVPAARPENPPAPQDRYIEITVKRGDVLEKVARANGTTVGAIKRANQLTSERLSVGQTLKIPVTRETPPSSPSAERREAERGEAVYYVVKSGDSPWKIAKQCNVKFEDILRLNQLDEEKARNLKIGDRIRVK